MLICAAKPHLFSIARRAADPPRVSHRRSFLGKPILGTDSLKRYIVTRGELKPALGTNASTPYSFHSMEPENELIAQRREKLEALRARGVEPFGRGFDTSGSIAEVREKFKEGETL